MNRRQKKKLEKKHGYKKYSNAKVAEYFINNYDLPTFHNNLQNAINNLVAAIRHFTQSEEFKNAIKALGEMSQKRGDK